MTSRIGLSLNLKTEQNSIIIKLNYMFNSTSITVVPDGYLI